jgi:hypothetical protein
MLFAREPRHHRFKFGVVIYRRGSHRHSKGPGRFLDGLQHPPPGKDDRIIEDRHVRDRRGDLRQHFQPFSGHR